MTNRFATSLAANQLGFVISAVCAFAIAPLTVSFLGDQLYGVWSLFMSFSGHYGLLTFGLQSAMSRYFAYSLAQEDVQSLNGYYSTVQLMLFFSALATILAGLLLSLFIDRILTIPGDQLGDIRLTCTIVAITAGVTFLMAPLNGMLVGGRLFGAVNAVGIGSTLIRTVLVYVLLVNGGGILHLSLLNLGVTLMAGLCQLGMVRRFFKGLRLGLGFIKKVYFLDLIGFGMKSFAINIATLLVYQCDLFVIGTCLPPERITIYSLGLTMITYYVQLISSGVGVMTPYLVARYAKTGLEGLRVLFFQLSALLLMVSGVIVSGCVVYGEAFYHLWMGPGYAESALVMIWLMIPQFFITGARVITSTLIAVNHLGPIAKIAVGEGMLNLCLSIWLVQFMGLKGVALGTIIPSLISSLMVMPLIAAGQMGLGWKDYLIKSILPGLGMLTAGAGVGLLVYRLGPPDTWLFFAISVILTVLGCLPLFLIILKLAGINLNTLIRQMN